MINCLSDYRIATESFRRACAKHVVTRLTFGSIMPFRQTENYQCPLPKLVTGSSSSTVFSQHHEDINSAYLLSSLSVLEPYSEISLTLQYTDGKYISSRLCMRTWFIRCTRRGKIWRPSYQTLFTSSNFPHATTTRLGLFSTTALNKHFELWG